MRAVPAFGHNHQMLTFVRIWLPAVVILGGVAVMIIGGFDDIALEGGAGIVGAGLAIWLMNVLFRFGLHDDKDRDAEDAARRFLDEHGHWPDEPAPAPPSPSPRGRAEPTSRPAAGAPAPRRIPRRGSQLPPRRPR